MAIRHWHLDSGAIRINNFPENEIQIAIPIHLLAAPKSIPIDSTGEKSSFGFFKIPPSLVKHIKSAIFAARGLTPTATDAVVNVNLKDLNTGTILATLEYAGDSGYKETNVNIDDLKNAVGDEIYSNLYVTTASATAGATQEFRSVVLVLILGIS